MTFISYAQNFEDVMLWRALKGIDKGFYIDVGACSPDIHSVTKAFYDRGWSGINIEPNPVFAEQLHLNRVRDSNLCIAIGENESQQTINFFENTGLSTLDNVIAEQHQAQGYSVTRVEVQVKSLNSIWKENITPGQDIHFIKIDVEGFEESVLRSNDWSKNRPWIVLVEATLPLTQVESHATWEPLLLSNNYVFAYADGLNRFYISIEMSKLLIAFRYPPNIFDDFISHRTHLAEEKSSLAEKRIIGLSAEVSSIVNSKTWKLTLPLRWTIKRFRLIQIQLKRFLSIKRHEKYPD